MSEFATIAPALAGALSSRGYEQLTPVQAAMLRPGVEGADLLVSAQTGSGKTVAFGIAIAPELLDGEERLAATEAPLALVIAPTRELALQVKRELEWLYAPAGAQMASCVGGMDMRQERRVLDRGAHIVVGTPGRLRDHITRGSLDISALKAVVLDEADEMLDLGFREDLEFILDASPAERRTLMFSATVPKAIADLARQFQRNAQRIAVAGEGPQHGDIDYRLINVVPAERENAIINTLLYFDAQNAMVFCSTREAVKHLAARLNNRGFSVVALSGELSQAERTNALQSMRDGRARVCVATDVAARGIDLPNLDLVVHADLPSNPDTLLHRSGRTGRAGRKGICALIVPHHRQGSARRLLKIAKLEATAMPAPGAVEIARMTRERILADPALSEHPNEDEAELVAELLAAYAPEQIAAAWLRAQMAARPSAEELSDGPTPRHDPMKGERPDTRFTEGKWFRISLGRKHKAEPRWLLPMICKAGHVTKTAVGSIRILDTESHFEIEASKAAGYLAAVERHGAGEKGVSISALEGEAGSAPEKRIHRKGPRPEAHAGDHDAPRPAFAKPVGRYEKPDGKKTYVKKPKRPKA